MLDPPDEAPTQRGELKQMEVAHLATVMWTAIQRELVIPEGAKICNK